MDNQLVALCTEENAKLISEFILSKLEMSEDKESIDYDFHLLKNASDKEKLFSQNASNLSFKFDLSSSDLLHKISQVYFEDMRSEITKVYNDFLKKIIGYLSTEENLAKLEKLFSFKIFKQKESILTINSIYDFWVENLLPGEKDRAYQLIIEKEVPARVVSENSEKTVSVAPEDNISVSAELFKIHDATGKGFNQIIHEKKKAGDPKYKNVKSAITKRFMWDCQISFVAKLKPV